MKTLLFLLIAFSTLATQAQPVGTAGRLEEALAAYKQKNVTEAFQLFRPLAAGGNATAQFYLGVMLANGQGVAKNEPEAAHWYLKTAEQGNAIAQTNLGVMLANGRGVAKNEAEAVQWYRKAASKGDEYAFFNLGKMYKTGRGVARNDVLAYAYFNLAAGHGHTSAASVRDDMFATLTQAQGKEGQTL